MRIGVWNTAFLGDTILTLPLLQILRRAYPDAMIDFWVRSSYRELYAEQSDYTSYGYTKKNGLGGLYQLGKEIRKKDYDIWINPHPSYRSTYIMSQSKAKIRLSYTKPYINRIVSSTSIERSATLHEVDRLCSLTDSLGINKQYSLPCYSIPKHIEEEVSRLSSSKSSDSIKSLSFAIGALWKTKRWLPEYFADVMKRAITKGYNVYFVGGGKEEEAILEAILQYSGMGANHPQVYSFLNASLPITACVLRRSTVCCGNDTGLMHLAWIQNIPTIALFGPTVEEQGFYPQSEGSASLGIDIACRPCGKHGSNRCKRVHFECMRELKPTMVWEAIEKAMKSDDVLDKRSLSFS